MAGAVLGAWRGWCLEGFAREGREVQPGKMKDSILTEGFQVQEVPQQVAAERRGMEGKGGHSGEVREG